MKKYFNIFLEFNHSRLHEIINKSIADKGKYYICVVDAHVLTLAQKDNEYRKIINDSLVNTCDGSSIALMAGLIYRKNFRALNGPEIFELYIEKPYTHVLLGSTESVLNKIRITLQKKGINSPSIYSLPLPFNTVDEFDYVNIANKLNSLNPDIIWVSLGAPKQEIFMSKLLPQINSGVMFGIGAAFNFYIGELTIPQIRMGRLRFIWLNRLFNEPQKMTKRVISYLIALPRIYWEERKKRKEL